MGDAPTGLRLPQELADKLMEVAQSKNISRSALIRMVLQEYVDGVEKPVVVAGGAGVDQEARQAFEMLLGRVRALEESDQELRGRFEAIVGAVETQAAITDGMKDVPSAIGALQSAFDSMVASMAIDVDAETATPTKTNPRAKAFEAGLRKAQESPKPKSEAKGWASQFNS